MNATRTPTVSREILPAAAWRERVARHARRVRRWTVPLLERRARGRSHPVHDFLFTYYFQSPRKLEQWHPDHAAALVEVPDPPAWLLARPYRIRDGRRFADPAGMTAKHREALRWIAGLLRATAARPPNFACHGLHEWAMVFGGGDLRHRETCPLRLPQREIDELVKSRPLCCSHYDAFRFFQPRARPLNRLRPSFETRADHEQPGCVHANMDLYKWASKAMPWIGSELQFECFELAVELREIDMRASPYDLAAFGYPPIAVETPEGRREYESHQRRLADRAAPLRDRLAASLESLLDASAA